MRCFPRAVRSRAAAASAAVALIVGALAAPLAQAGDDLDDRRDRVQREIRQTQQSLEHSSRQARQASTQVAAARQRLQAARSELAAVERRLVAAKQRDRQAQQRLQRTQERLATARAQLAEGRRALAEQREQVVDRVVSTYEQGDPRLLTMSSFLDAESPEEFMTARTGQEIIADRQDDLYRDLEVAEAQLTARKEQVQQIKQDAAAQRRQAGRHLSAVRTLTRQAKQARTRMWQRVEESRSARKAALRARDRDHRALKQLRQREARIKAQIMRLRGGASHTGSTGGFLQRPTSGRISSPYGYRRHPIYGYRSLHNGIDYATPCGTPAVAGATGRVVSTYYDQVYGRRLFLYVGKVNGANLTLVYNHLSSYAVSTGRTVARGETVARVGTTGWSTGCHLHFTVLRNGVAVPPGPYL